MDLRAPARLFIDDIGFRCLSRRCSCIIRPQTEDTGVLKLVRKMDATRRHNRRPRVESHESLYATLNRPRSIHHGLQRRATKSRDGTKVCCEHWRLHDGRSHYTVARTMHARPHTTMISPSCGPLMRNRTQKCLVPPTRNNSQWMREIETHVRRPTSRDAFSRGIRD